MKKVIVIEHCWDCPHCETFGLELHCQELTRRVRGKNIPKSCPLDDARRYEEMMWHLILEQACTAPKIKGGGRREA